MLIINADDWGYDAHTTNRILACVERGSISSVSAMVFMEDSERAAAVARDRGIDAGLHLNLDTPFSKVPVSSKLAEHQAKLARFLRSPFSRPFFHPGLVRSFEYVVSSQLAEYDRLYGAPPRRIDGHHHLHLAANVLLGRLLPHGTILRPHFSKESGEKRIRNSFFRCYSKLILARSYRTVDGLFALPPLEPKRLMHIFARSREITIEVETHPTNPTEFEFLTGGALFRLLGEIPLSHYHVPIPA
ncbi:MAG TPA: ChbG/HpnK family deacetylase [Terriglobales bacterium]|nr:ChbG/HpnK family deacetylase [Terriglobales bacterium]